MLPNILFKLFTLFTITCLLIISSPQTANASNIGKPVIAMSRIECGGFYLLEIYENGVFELRSTAHNYPHVYRSKINQEDLKKLVTLFEKANFIESDNRQPDLGILKDAIHFRQGDRESTVVYPSNSTNPLIKNLTENIIHTTKLNSLLPSFKYCFGSNDRAIFFKYLKFK
jgi:hypothetical protein